MDRLKKIAKKTRKALGNQVTNESVIQYIQTKGYVVVFYNSDTALLNHFSLTDYAKTSNAFTYLSENTRIVFIRETLSAADKLRSLLHELSHIVLGHLKTMEAIRDKRKEETEAEVLAYFILTCKTT